MSAIADSMALICAGSSARSGSASRQIWRAACYAWIGGSQTNSATSIMSSLGTNLSGTDTHHVVEPAVTLVVSDVSQPTHDLSRVRRVCATVATALEQKSLRPQWRSLRESLDRTCRLRAAAGD